MGREPGAGVMQGLDAQGLANTLWAYARMGREPGAGVMKGLEGRAEAVTGSFNAQNVANTLWAYARMVREPGAGGTFGSSLASAHMRRSRSERGRHIQ